MGKAPWGKGGERECDMARRKKFEVREWFKEPNEDGEVLGYCVLKTDSMRRARAEKEKLGKKFGEDSYAILEVALGLIW